jgi:hypothetical protein
VLSWVRGCSGARARRRHRRAGAVEQTGGGAEGVSVSARLRVRVPGGGGNPFVGRRGSLGVRAQGGGSPEILGGRCAGEKGRRGGEGALPVGSLGQREGEGNGRCQDWAERAGPSWLSARERKRKEWAVGRGGRVSGERKREGDSGPARGSYLLALGNRLISVWKRKQQKRLCIQAEEVSRFEFTWGQIGCYREER